MSSQMGKFQHGYFNGKKISGCEVLSFNEDTGVGLANFRGMLVRFEGRKVEVDSRAAEYAKLDVHFNAHDMTLELEDLACTS